MKNLNIKIHPVSEATRNFTKGDAEAALERTLQIGVSIIPENAADILALKQFIVLASNPIDNSALRGNINTNYSNCN